MRAGAAVLCAGGGSRYRPSSGEHKLLAPFRGRPLVSWALEHALGAGLEATVVVTGAVDIAGLLPAGVTRVENPSWESGIASSLQCAVVAARRLGLDAIVVGLGDQPLVPAPAWRAVAVSCAPIAVATYGGARRHPVRLDRSVWAELPTTGDEGARALMRRRPGLVEEVACEGDPFDVDTVADLSDVEV
ncbi:MAG: nucleotidyltransferase family protein [Acidimicrobiales bacterium]